MSTEIKNPVMRAWFKMALEHGQKHDSFCEIAYGTEQHKSWSSYFWGLGWSPVTFRWIAADKTWTAPCEWPHDLPAFTKKLEAKPLVSRVEAPKSKRLSEEELDAQFERLRLKHLRPGCKFNPPDTSNRPF